MRNIQFVRFTVNKNSFNLRCSKVGSPPLAGTARALPYHFPLPLQRRSPATPPRFHLSRFFGRVPDSPRRSYRMARVTLGLLRLCQRIPFPRAIEENSVLVGGCRRGLAVAENDVDALTDYRRQGPSALKNHLTPEHFLQLFVTMWAARAEGRVLHSVVHLWGDIHGRFCLGLTRR